jgi:hypothetical protein
MSDADDKTLDSHIETAAALLALPIEPEWLPTIRTNLRAILRFAGSVDDFTPPDDAEPASVFKA